MPFFTDSEQLYATMKALLARVEEEDQDATHAILASHMVIRLSCNHPSATVTINGRKRPLETAFGESNLRPTLDIRLEADTLHQIMLGELSMKRALAQGKLKVKGPIWKAGALGDLFHRGQTIYPSVLQELDLARSPSSSP